METSLAASLLPDARLQALDAELASMEAVLTALRYAEGDGRGVIPWMEPVSPRLCEQVCAALDFHDGELGEDGDVDADEVRTLMQAELRVMRRLQAQRERLERVLALTDEVAGAIGSDMMQLAMALYGMLCEAGRADRITALADARARRRGG